MSHFYLSAQIVHQKYCDRPKINSLKICEKKMNGDIFRATCLSFRGLWKIALTESFSFLVKIQSDNVEKLVLYIQMHLLYMFFFREGPIYPILLSNATLPYTRTHFY